MLWKTTDGGLREYLIHFDSNDEIIIYHDYWRVCPRCASLNTQITDESRPYEYHKVVRKCDNCGKQWDTKFYNSDYLEEFDTEDDYEDYDEIEMQRFQMQNILDELTGGTERL